MKINSRDWEVDTVLSQAFYGFQDELVEKISNFLDIVIQEEFDELRSSIEEVKAMNNALMEENAQQGEAIFKLTNQVEQLSSALCSTRIIRK